ncbi:GH15 family glucan-1,4-alpha-glucosidase [Friedmanniella endophytica]|uniref:GH15 family glucan-1,4-alpha-glucosidase n=1 Tax=Microlunatus kandeliicorticis TaxID=1759536 RepID=A0A7W3IPM0_9ACTN|nr:glycoside hydrolase family 15 protein [Microlunatus kandeliicorticis]MBA8792909.1 GH15 family glucan-1,4-alpha-glucosidase [Microlunatus kandeliicorticis]
MYPPHTLRDYALIADGCRGALVGPRGDISWLCAPRWDSPAVISHLVGGDGIYAVTPTDTFVWGGCYEPNSMIWRSHWVAGDTMVESRDALAFPGEEHRLVLLRRISADDRPVRVGVLLRLSGDFGTTPMTRPRLDDDGRWHSRVGELYLRWSGAPEASWTDHALRTEITVEPGRSADLVLEISDRPLLDPPQPDRAWSATENAWREAVPDLAHAAAPRDAGHAYAVLRSLTSPGGGMVAAATLGLPERAEAGKNYDYRYAWIRDQVYAGMACAVDQPFPLLGDALDFTCARLLEHGDAIAPGYRIDGSDIPGETTLDLPGYPGGAVKVGNWVRQQFQLDALGEMLELLAAGARLDHLDSHHVEAIDVAIGVIERKWTDAEAGIWELDDAWWTQSRLAAVAGLRAVAQQLPSGQGAKATGLADAILAETSRRCLAPDGSWQRSPEHPGVDASLLLPAVRGGLPAHDPRTLATLARVESDLVQDHHVYRYRPDERALGEAEGSFTLCGFILSLALLQQGDVTEAYRYFDIQRSVCGPPGLLSEEFDVAQRQLRGNAPQAFVHAMLLETAQRLALA